MVHDEITTVVILSRYTGATRFKTVCGLSINASGDDHE